jgi:hypothetical protein
MARVGEEETAFANRREPYLLGIETTGRTSRARMRTSAGCARSSPICARTPRGASLNFPGFLEEGDELLHRGYGRNYARLVGVKTKYDRRNLFRLNANIEPRKLSGLFRGGRAAFRKRPRRS